MAHLIEFLRHLINPEWIIHHGGLYLVIFMIFAETGLFVGFFLPGDSLLFVSGIYGTEIAHDFFNMPFFIIMFIVAVAGVFGNFAGYWFGHKSGPYLFHRKDTFFFKKKHLFTAKEFYDKHGGGAIIFARFLPIVRTFAPIVAGIVQMEFKKFTLFNIIGSFAWVFVMMLAGHYLNQVFPNLKEHLELIVLIIVIITTGPVLFKLFFNKKPVTQ